MSEGIRSRSKVFEKSELVSRIISKCYISIRQIETHGYISPYF